MNTKNLPGRRYALPSKSFLLRSLAVSIIAAATWFTVTSAEAADQPAATTREFTLQSATIRPDGRILRLVFLSDGEPADYGPPDRDLSNVGNKVLTLSTKAKLEYLGSFAMRGELPPLDLYGDWHKPLGGKLPVGNYCLIGVVKDSSGNVWGRTVETRFSINALGERPSLTAIGGQAYPFGYTSEIYLSQPNGGPSTLGLYKTFTFANAGSLDGATPGGPTFAPGVPLDLGTWQNASQAPPSYKGISWTSDYLIADDSAVVTLNAGDLKVSAPVGLLTDVSGNKSAAFSEVAVTNNSLVDHTGFTDSSLSAKAEDIRYVASAEHGGSDANDGSEKTPFLTFDQAMNYLWHTYPRGKVYGAIRFLRGDTFTCQHPPEFTTSGTGRATPLTIESYWNPDLGKDPGMRPIIACSEEGYPFILGSVSNVLIRGLHLQGDWNSLHPPSVPGGPISRQKAFSTFQASTAVTVDDCVTEHFVCGVALETASHANTAKSPEDEDFIHDVTFLRCIFRDNFGQGIYCQSVKDMMLSQCILDRNGRDEKGYGNVFQHNMYYNTKSYPLAMWGTYIGRAAADGTQLRSGGRADYCVYDANAIAGFCSGIGGGFYKTVITESSDTIGEKNVEPKGWGLELIPGGVGSYDTIGCDIDSCLFMNLRVGTVNKTPISLEVRKISPGTDHYSAVQRNIFFNSGIAVKFDSGKGDFSDQVGKLKMSANTFDCTPSQTFLFDASPPASWSWYASDHDYFIDGATAKIADKLVPVLTISTEGSWANLTKSEEHSKAFTPHFAGNASTNLGTYGQTLGIKLTSEDDFRNYLRDRPFATWGVTYEMQPIYNFFAGQFREVP